jgi:hypothetical protein
VLPAAAPAAQPAVAPVIVDSDDDDADSIIDLGAGEDEGDAQHDAIEAGIQLDEGGNFNFNHIVEMIDAEEEDVPIPEDDLLVSPPAAAQAVHAPAKPARRSARQQAALGKVLNKFDL